MGMEDGELYFVGMGVMMLLNVFNQRNVFNQDP